MLSLEIAGVQEALKTVDKTLVAAAERSAVKKISAQVKTGVSRAISGSVGAYNIKTKRVKEALSIQFNRRRRSVTFSYKGKPPGLQHYKATQIKRGTKVRVMKDSGRKLIKHAFVVKKGLPKGGTGVFWRKGSPRIPSKGRYAGTKRKREPLKRLVGPSVPQMVKNHGIPAAKRVVREKAGAIFSHELAVKMGRIKRR